MEYGIKYWTILKLLQELDGAGLIITDEEILKTTLDWYGFKLDAQVPLMSREERED